MDRFDVTGSFGWATMIEDSEGLYVLFASHKQALSEKDLAIAQANRHKDELFQKLAEKDAAYQQLMEKAVLFATWLKQAMDNEADEAQDANAFLESPEVQAWKEQK